MLRKMIATSLIFVMIFSNLGSAAVQAADNQFSNPSSRQSIQWEPMPVEQIEIPPTSDMLTVDWLSSNYPITENFVIEQLGKGYALSDIHQALKIDSNENTVSSKLSEINPEAQEVWGNMQSPVDHAQASGATIRQEKAAFISDAKLDELMNKAGEKLDARLRKSESPERAVETIGTASDASAHAKGLSAAPANTPPLPNLASNYDQAAANLMQIKSDQAPFSISNGGEQISTMTGELTIRNTDLTLPGRNGLSFSLDRVYNSSDSKYYDDDVKWRIYQRKWLFPVVTLYIEAVDANGIHHSSGIAPITMVWQPQYVLHQNIYWEFIPPAMFGFEYADENNLLPAAEAQMQSYINNTPWRGYRSAYGVTLYYYMYPTGQVVEIPIEHETLIQGYENKPNPTTDSESRFPLGKGWSWDLSYIKNRNGKKYITIKGTGTYEISSSNTLVGYPWKDLTFSSDSSVTVNGRSSSYLLKSISGHKQYFTGDGKLIREADNYGNTIDYQYTYVSPYGDVLTKVTDALQNTINITYSATKVTITSGDRTVVYNKAAAPGDKEFLGSVVDAEGRTTSYGYRLANTNYNFLGAGYADGQNYSLLLDTVYHPTGAHTDYQYAATRQLLGQTASADTWYVTSREDIIDYVDAPQERANRINFTHAGFPGSSYGVDTSFTSTVNDGLKQTTYTFKKDFIDQNTPAVFYNTSIVDQAGTAKRTVTMTYDEARRLPAPIQTTTQYMNGTSSSESITTATTYDDYGNVLTSTNPLGVTSSFAYDTATRLLKSASQPTAANSIQYTEYTRNAQGSVTQIAIREGHATGTQKQRTSFGYDAYGNINQVTVQDDNRNTVINYEYGAPYNYGYPTKQTTTVTDVNGQVSTIIQQMEYNPLTGLLTKLIDGKGYITSAAYDKLGRIVRETLPDASQTNVVYDDVLNTVTVTDMMGRIDQSVYDPFGRLKFKTMGLGYASYGYDSHSRQIWSEDAKRQRTQYQYDAWDRIVTMTNADNSTVQTQYNDTQFATTTIDEGNHAVREVYDKIGRLLRTEELRPSGTVVLASHTYDNMGNRLSATDAGGNTTQYEYDVLGRLTKVTDPEGRATSYTYSMANNLTHIQYPDSRSRIKVYDELGRLIQETDPAGQVKKYKYDANSNLVQAIDRKGRTINYSYNNRNLLTGSSTPDETISYTYDREGKRLSMTDVTGTTSYSYHSSTARLQDITYPDGTMLDFEYDVQSLVSRYILSDSRVVYGYDSRNRVNSIEIQGHDHMAGDQWFVYTAGDIQHTFNPDGTLSYTSYNDGLFTRDYVYENLNLTALSSTRSNQSVINSSQYGYDNNRNIISRNENGQASSFTYDTLQRIKTSSQFNESYQYDARGNRSTLSSDLSPTVPLASYLYDDRDRLIQVTAVDGHTVQYRYNGDGLLYERVENGITTRYYYDEQGNLFREGIVETDGSVQLTARYIYDPQRAGPIARDDLASDVVLYYLGNGHGDVVNVVDGVGNIVNEYAYDIWGNPLTVSELAPTPFRYSGEYWDDTTGLQYLRARWYDPSVGRFINEDTYEGTLTNPLSQNLYTYVHNNPVNYTDPSGNFAVPAILAYVLLTAVETIPDVALDFAISKYTNEEFNFAKSAAENFAFNLIPGLGEAKSIKQISRLSEGMRQFYKGAGNSIISRGRVSVDAIKANPSALSGKSVDEIAQMLRNEGYDVTVQASTKSSSGAQIIKINNTGGDRNITQVQVSPGGGRHGGSSYVKISTNDQGIIKVVDGTESAYKTDGKETATIIFTGGK